jgi:hypothetical protein
VVQWHVGECAAAVVVKNRDAAHPFNG